MHVADFEHGLASAGSTEAGVFSGYRDDVDDNDGTTCVNIAKYLNGVHSEDYADGVDDKTVPYVADVHSLDRTNKMDVGNDLDRVNIVESAVSSKDTNNADVTGGTNGMNGANTMQRVRIKQKALKTWNEQRADGGRRFYTPRG